MQEDFPIREVSYTVKKEPNLLGSFLSRML